jgi:glucose/arabinose dehydrogenase
MSTPRNIKASVLVTALLATVLVGFGGATGATAATLPSGFQEQIVYSGLNQPTNIEFSPDGRVFVAQKNGVIKVFDSLSDPTPDTFADLSVQVHNQWDRGLLGMALAPNFPTDPWVYVLYTYDAPLGQTAPVWNDVCADANGGNCIVSGRLSRLQASGNQMTGTEQVLISDWCQQFPSHSIGDLHFGADGALYVSGGDGASFSATDYGQFGSPVNPCGDPPGGAMSPPTAEGGALRSQDVRSTADPTGLDGAILRLDPATGAALPTNPQAGSSDPNTRRIVAHGLRNPFRFTIRPGTNEAWIGDVGWNTWEEVNRVVSPTAGVTNFGWPCYEGVPTQPGYDSANLNLCESLYAAGGATPPYYTYNHGSKVVPGESCPTGSSSITGLAFYPTGGGPYPSAYNGALFFADYSRNCIWAMMPGIDGLPNPGNIITFAAGAAAPVDLAIGPGNELYYVDLGGTIRRIRYFPGDQPPTAVPNASPVSGSTPLTVSFDGSASFDPDPADQNLLTYQWDFTNDGTFDATGPAASYTYTVDGTYTAALRVTDTLGVSDTKTVTITAGNSTPTAFIDSPTSALTWQVGDTITFSGHATDPQDGTLPDSALSWQLLLQHCSAPNVCHTHLLNTFIGVSSGSFTAPDHEYPSYLQLQLTATDSGGLTGTTTVSLQPKTVDLSFATNPSGLQLAVGSTSQTAPFTRTVIVGSTNSVSAPTPQTLNGVTYNFASWSDGGAQTHVITAPATATGYTATYNVQPSCADSVGYTCSTAARPFIPADATVLPLTGDNAVTQIGLPFAMSLYGQTYTSAWVDTNGKLSFVDPGASSAANTAIPTAAAPNATVYAFWDDLVVDASASVRTTVVGTAPDRQFVVEWRNVVLRGNGARRITVEALLYENGNIATNYKDLGNAVERGKSATVGIENEAGTVALQYSFNSVSLSSGVAVLFRRPGAPAP